MPISFLTTALLIVSVITNLTVEGIKKLLDGTKVKYSSNVLAAVMYLGFLISTVGYDKVIQMLKQIQSAKEETKNE